MTTDGPDSPHVDDTPSAPPPDLDDAPEGDASPANSPSPDEARGPRLPDRWPVLAFIGLAVLAAWATYPNPPAWTIESFAAFLLDVLPTVCAVLLPAALLLRHPDAPRVARPLVFGTLLVAAVPFLKLAGPQLESAFASLTPPPPELDWFVPSSVLYRFFHSLLGLFGILYIALGLSQARHWAFRSSARAAGLIVLAVGIVTSLVTVYTFTQADLSSLEMTPSIWAYLIGSVTLGVLTIMTWAYLAMTIVRSALSGEEPGLGWTTAAIGAVLIVLTFAIGAWANVVQTTNASLQNVIFWVSNTSYALGFLLLLIGFLLGMPSLEPVEWAEDDADLDDDREDGEADETERDASEDIDEASDASRPAG